MDKQKQNHYMGIDVSMAWQRANQRTVTMATRPPLCDTIAEELAQMGYRKIPENAVVLTVEEIVEFEKGLRENWQKDCETIRKETVEKFEKRLEEVLTSYVPQSFIEEIIGKILEGEVWQDLSI